MSQRLAASLALAAALALAPGAAHAQELLRSPVPPVPVTTPLGGNGHAETWDGRVFIVTRNIAEASYQVGWAVIVCDRPLRPGRAPAGAQDTEIRPLGLSADEKADLAAFVRALAGTTLDRSVPQLPGVGRRRAVRHP